ncbi:MAG: SMC family ATPase [Caldisericia bacterium]|nr:SMC family ATPase [Caldisericia bacterium]
MIPISISVTNFLSYKDTHTLSFKDSGTFIITGNNGAGKSALFDAIVFSLFGISRNTETVSNEHLLHFGTTEGKIDFVFTYKDTFYNITRKINRTLNHHSIIFREKNGKYWKDLSGTDDKETQFQIQSILSISPDRYFLTELKSSTILNYKEFILQNGYERYYHLKKLLGLDVFDSMQKTIDKDIHTYSVKKTVMENFIAENKSKLKQEKVLQKIIENEVNLLASVKKEIGKTEEEIDSNNSLFQKIESGLQKKKILMEKISQLRYFQNERREEKKEFKDRTNELQKSIKLQHEIENGYKQLVDLVDRNNKYNENLEQRQRIEKQIEEIQKIIENEEILLKEKRNGLEQKEIEFSNKKSKLPDLNLKIQDVKSKLKEMQRVKYQVKKLEVERESIQSQIARKSESFGMLKKEILNIREKKGETYEQVVENDRMIKKDESVKKNIQTIEENKEKVTFLQDKIDNEIKKKEILLIQNQQFENMVHILVEKIKILDLPRSQENRCPVCGTPIKKEKESEILLNYKRDMNMKQATLQKNMTTLQRIILVINSLKSDIKILSSEFHLEDKLNKKYIQIQECKSNMRKLNESYYQVKLQESKTKEDIEKTNHSINDLKSRYKTADDQYIEMLYVLSNEMELQKLLSNYHVQISEALEVDQQLPGISRELLDIKRRIETKDYLKDHWEKLNSLKKKLFTIPYSAPEHDLIKNKINQFRYFETEKRVMDEKLNEKNRMVSSLNNIEEKLIEIDANILGYSENVKAIPYQNHDLKNIKDSLDELQIKIESLRQKNDLLGTSIDEYKRDMINIHELNKKYEKTLIQFQEFSKKEKMVTICKDLLNESNITVYIIENTLPYLEISVNKILSNLSNSNLYVSLYYYENEITSQPSVGIYINQNTNKVQYQYLSSGEKFKIDMALRLGLSSIVSSDKYKDDNFLFIDEDFGSLDSSSKNQIICNLLSLQNHFKKLLLITHSDEFQNCFEKHITIEKNQNVSSFF